MPEEFKRYGEAEIGGAYYLVRTIGPAAKGVGGYESAATYHVDGLGQAELVATAAPDRFTAEEIAKLPTLAEAQTQHLGPAFREAEANARKWQEEQERLGRDFSPPEPPQFDRPTAWFLDDEEDEF